MINGEYWINDGSVEYADGDIGDSNHESIAYDHIIHLISDDIISIAEDLDIDVSEVDQFNGVDSEALGMVIYNILEIYEQKLNDQQAFIALAKEANTTVEVLNIVLGRGDCRFYVMKYEGWIAVRGTNIELFGYDENKRLSLLNGLEEIFYQENGEEPEESDEDFWLYDHKTNKNFSISLDDIKNPIKPRPQFNPTSGPVDRRFNYTAPDTVENMPKTTPLQPLPPQNKIPGHQSWRGTSESFREWFYKRTP